MTEPQPLDAPTMLPYTWPMFIQLHIQLFIQLFIQPRGRVRTPRSFKWQHQHLWRS